MNTKLISENALNMIDQYKNFRIENAICSIPYFNNKREETRGGLRVEIGKGSPRDIFEEVQQIVIKNKINLKLFDSNSLKKFLIENNIGIDCSGYVYYILDEESKSRGNGPLDKHLAFPFCKGIFGKIKCKIRPIENTDVQTLNHDYNSKVIQLKDIQAGDIITMTGSGYNGDRDHTLVIYQIEYQNFSPIVLHYTHATAWPTDGEYGHGIHTGKIEILDLNKDLVNQRWIENDRLSEEQNDGGNYTFARGQKSITQLRRLNWF